MKKLHVTIQNGGPVQLVKCVQCCSKYHCPFCKPELFKPTVESKVRKHIKAHEKRAVRFKGYAIYKCGLNCKPVSHFHCPKCSRLMEKKNKFLEHLDRCVGTVTQEDRENLSPVQQEAERCNLSVKEEVERCPVSEEQEGQPAVVLGEELHVTIQNGGPVQLAKCVQCCSKYHCPFCKPEVFKPTVESKVRKHIKAHEKRAVRFKGYIIFKCGLNCRPVSHFHCPKCCRLLEKRNRFVDHLSKCVGGVKGEGGGHHVAVRQKADGHGVAEEEENNPVPVAQMSLVEEITPAPLSACSEVEEESWREAVKSLQTFQETSIFKSSEVLVSTRCLLELFQFCWLCRTECCITIEGSEKLFSVTQDCQGCGFHRDWRSRPPSDQPDNNEEEHTVKNEDDEEEVVVQIVSSDNECSEQVFIEQDGSYLTRDDKEARLQEEEMKKTRKRKRKASSDEQEPCLDEESDVSVDEDVFRALKEDGFKGKLVVWCTQCRTEASLSCSVHRHRKVFCCAQCSAGDHVQTHGTETLPVGFDDVGSFQKHAEQEHGDKPFYILCQDCGKFVTAKKQHVCEHKVKCIICPECGKRFLTEGGLKTHYTQLHSDYDHPCKYCLKVFRTRSAKLEHEQTHPKDNQPYSCPDCPERFQNIHQRSRLKNHCGLPD